LKVVVVDNGGGGIFKIIEGAKNEPSVPRFFETPHERDLIQWINGWGLKAVELVEPNVDALNDFFGRNQYEVLIVKTHSDVNPIELDLFFEYFKQQNERVENN
jgi:2-succinyl-5-enolpyruvyl-6-hydroxy-3-cyclohexene-1-carboxylate synthase